MGKRRKFTPRQKLEIVLAGLSSEDGISDVCRQHGISTVLFYKWKDQLVKNAPEIYKRKSRKKENEEHKLRDIIKQKERVIAIFAEENLQLKKNLGE